MLRFLTFATLILVAVCLALGASIALAADQAPPAQERGIEAVDLRTALGARTLRSPGNLKSADPQSTGKDGAVK